MRNPIEIILLICSLSLTNGLIVQVNTTIKTITVTTLPSPVSDPQAIPALFKQLAIPYHPIDQVNWLAYPYQPAVQFAIAYTDKAIYLHYKVQEQHIKALAIQDNGKVFQDACVEFFVQPDSNDLTYYNFEFNCIGRLLLQAGKTGNRTLASPEILNRIKRWSSLGSDPVDIRDSTASWELAVIIPLGAFYLNPMISFADQTFKGNFYKCGSKLDTPHYLSWSPIYVPKPQFHSLDYFGNIYFK